MSRGHAPRVSTFETGGEAQGQLCEHGLRHAQLVAHTPASRHTHMRSMKGMAESDGVPGHCPLRGEACLWCNSVCLCGVTN